MTTQEACAFMQVFTVVENAFVELNWLGIGVAGIADWLDVDTHLFDGMGTVGLRAPECSVSRSCS